MGLYFSKVEKVTDDRHPLGTHMAVFGTTSDVATAFRTASAKAGLSERGGIVRMDAEHINQRIAQLGGDPNDATKDANVDAKRRDSVAELRKGLKGIERVVALEVAANAVKTAPRQAVRI